MKQIFTAVLFIASFLFIKTNIASAQINTGDSLALVDFYNSTDGAHWTTNTNWLTTAPVSTWAGITVSDNRVTEILIGNFGVNGPIPESFGNLTALKKFSANYGIKGALPSSIGNLTSLQSLAIFFCDGLTAPLPSSLGNLKNLQYLFLYSDNITGTIPSSLGNLTNLLWLNLSASHLKGSIPASLNNLKSLEILDLSFNRLMGTIPNLTNLHNLTTLSLQGNRFTFAGMEKIVNAFPFAVYSPQANIPLHNNNNTLSVYAGGAHALADNTYKWYKGSTLVAIITGDSTYQPTISGNYSVAITNSVATALTLYSDTVYVKTTINISDSLALVDFYNSTDGPHWYDNTNWLTAAPVSTWFGITVDNNRVTEISFGNNALDGPLPASFGNLTGLKTFAVYYGIRGVLPSSLGNLASLQTFALIFCDDLTGEIPSSLGNLKNLETLYLNSNKLSGTIPSSLGNLSKLKWLNLTASKLEGSIPTSLNRLTNLEKLDLSFNKLSGTIPDLSGLHKLNDFSLQVNQLNGNIPSYLGTFIHLKNVALGYNNLSGSIPPELGNLDSLSSLELYANHLTREIPENLNRLTELNVLDLSDNQLSGTIPSLNNLKLLYRLNLNKNNFTFAGMGKLISTFPFASYAPQAVIPLRKNGNELSVSVGSIPYNNTYYWYKDGKGFKTKRGDSTFHPKISGAYYVKVINSVATELTLHSDTIYYNADNNLIASENSDLNTEHSFSSISIYPNPAKTSAILSFNANGKYAITIADVSGKILQTKTGVAIKDTNIIQLNVSNYASGLYLVTITDEKNRKQAIRLSKE